jgi:hypothetical protein
MKMTQPEPICSIRYITYESAILFVLLPGLFALFGADNLFLIIPALFIGAGYCLYVLTKAKCSDTSPAPSKRALRGVMARFILGGLILSATVYHLNPEGFLDLPGKHPQLWLMILLLYPLLSVLPQELIYRKFLFSRCQAAHIESHSTVILLSSLSFCFAHLLFGNWQAMALSLTGGMLFAYTYHKSRSLLIVWLEHSLWGDLIFTIGLGKYFVGGSVVHLLI